jgi:hypothetical protein
MNAEKMTRERFENVRKMLESPDKENQVLGLAILEQQDFKENMAFILLAKKYTHATNAMWEEEAPTIYKQLGEIQGLDLNKVFTFKSILRALTVMQAPYDQIQFYLSTFSAYLLEQLNSLGYDFIEDLDLNIKLKQGYEQPGEPVESD